LALAPGNSIRSEAGGDLPHSVPAQEGVMQRALKRPAAWLKRCLQVTEEPASRLSLRLLQPPTACDVSFHRIDGPGQPEFRELCRLLCSDSLYWVQTQPAPMTEPGAAALLSALPAPARSDEKYLWSLRIEGQLVGCMDVLREWPARHTLSIGFLMIDPQVRRRGIGIAALAQLRERTRAWAGIRRWRVAVVQSQDDALRFWRSAGFVETGERTQAKGQHAAQIVLERSVGR
jgi:GNAT superfamily N-acetyltransferase